MCSPQVREVVDLIKGQATICLVHLYPASLDIPHLHKSKVCMNIQNWNDKDMKLEMHWQKTADMRVFQKFTRKLELAYLKIIKLHKIENDLLILLLNGC